MTAPMDLTDDERALWEHAAECDPDAGWYEITTSHILADLPASDGSHIEATSPQTVQRLLQKLSDARAALREISALDCSFEKYVRVEAVEIARRALAETPTPVAVPARWDGLCANRRHGLDYFGQPCDLCKPAAPDPVAAARAEVYAECAAIARDESHITGESIADAIEAAAKRGARPVDAPDLALLAKFATGEGGRRTGVLMRAGYIKVKVTEKGCAALGGVSPAEGSITHADLMAVREKYGALYDAVFPGVTAALEALIPDANDLDAEMARGVLAQVEKCK